MNAVAVTPGRHGSLHLRDVPDPQPAPGDALVRVLEAGVCGTDLEIHKGLYGQAPPGSDYLILGHENLGVVEASPHGSSIEAGDLVVATVRRPCAESCRPCSEGQNDMCVSGHFTERGICGRHGFMSQWYTESPRYLIKLPAPLRPFAVLMEPMAVVEKGIDQAYQIQQRLAWEPRRAVVAGAGPVGILAAAALRLRGLEVTVAALEPEGSFKDVLLAQAGIDYVCTKDVPLSSLPGRLGPIDIVFEATGATPVVFPALQMLGADGVCVLSSVTPGESLVEVDLGSWNRGMVLGNRVVLGTVNAGRRHFEAAARDLEEAEVRRPGWLARLITRRLPFTDALRALERTTSDIKTVLEFN